MTKKSKNTDRETTPVDGFPIRVVADRTGVTTSTLRTWERRYNLLTPYRTPKGHRVYTEEDIRTVERALELLREGHTLPKITQQIRKPDMALGAENSVSGQTGVWEHYLQDTLKAIADFSHERIEAVFNEAISLYPLEMVTDRLVEPALISLGNVWQSQPAGIAEEHFYSCWVRNRFGARFHHGYSQARGARIICACLPGESHDIGLLLFALSAQSRGYRVIYFGPNLPLQQVSRVQERSSARAIIMSARTPVTEEQDSSLAELARQFDVPVMLGGLASDYALPVFEAAGGVRLGSRISVGLQLLVSRVDVRSGSSAW